jgi:hypothetical protein
MMELIDFNKADLVVAVVSILLLSLIALNYRRGSNSKRSDGDTEP